ncbi:oligosaccharide flippase family protein [Carnobacterium maltaromaticum]|uniref:oligosaccharide flippase family protein n=1 Tax=Carnobacterium maltaromaticum TaxID=2751 RepID=UPI0018CD07EC|nr:oligosaccharide flippase family protein [Carnobacterium maltaromaticum]
MDATKKDKNLKNILYNVLYLFFGNIVTKLLGAVATMIYIRYSGAENYGILSIALAFSVIVVFFTDAGIGQTTIREGTKKNSDLASTMYSYIKIRLVLLIVVAIFSVVFVLLNYRNEPEKKYAILALTLPTLLGGSMQSIGTIYFQIVEKMKNILFINVASSMGMSLVLILGVYFNFNIVLLCFSYGFANVIVGIYSIFLVTREIKISKKMNPMIFDQLLIFATNGIIVMLIPQIGPLILDKILTIKELGYYAAAFKIPSVLYQFPGVIATAFYPRLFHLGNEKEYEQHRAMSGFELKSMSILGAILALPLIVNPRFWIVTLLTEEMAPAIPALVFLSYLIFLQSIKYPLADFLTTVGRQKGRTVIMFIGLVSSISLYIILGVKFGLAGGAAAPVISEIVVIVGCILLIPKGRVFFVRNTAIIIGIFGVSILVYYLFLSRLHPLLGITMIECFFIGSVVSVQKDIRESLVVLSQEVT